MVDKKGAEPSKHLRFSQIFCEMQEHFESIQDFQHISYGLVLGEGKKFLAL